MYDWGYHSSDTSAVHVVRKGEDGARDEDLFDVALYDRECVDSNTGLDCETQSLNDLRELIGFANAAIQAGLDPLPVQDRIG
jgi:hypothetical protein